MSLPLRQLRKARLVRAFFIRLRAVGYGYHRGAAAGLSQRPALGITLSR